MGAAMRSMDLREIKRRDQFPAYYRQLGLTTTGQRIKHLMDATGVKAIRGGGASKQRETLALLEESTTLGYWRFLGDGK